MTAACSTETTDRLLHGWRVASALALPEAPLWRGNDRLADLEISFGAVPPLTNVVVRRPLSTIDSDGDYRFDVPGIATYGVDAAGRRITIEPADNADERDIRCFLLATVMAVVGYRRGLLPVHGAAIAIDGQAVVLAGPSAVGKSTLAAICMMSGATVLADDLVMLDPDGFEIGLASTWRGRPGVRAALPELRLWPDVIAGLGWVGIGQVVREGVAKRRFPTEGPCTAYPLSEVFVLGEVRDIRRESLRQITNADAVDVLQAIAYRGELGEVVLGPGVMAARAVWFAMTARVWRVDRTISLDRDRALSDTLLAITRTQRP